MHVQVSFLFGLFQAKSKNFNHPSQGNSGVYFTDGVFPLKQYTVFGDVLVSANRIIHSSLFMA